MAYASFANVTGLSFMIQGSSLRFCAHQSSHDHEKYRPVAELKGTRGRTAERSPPRPVTSYCDGGLPHASDLRILLMIRHVRRRWADRRTRVKVHRLPAAERFDSSVGTRANTAGIPG